jgi:predicted anti-sigma-YlaC factor YlaD
MIQMKQHVEKWLAAYHDGELDGKQLKQVEAHLEACQPCRRELEKLAVLRSLLLLSPEPEGLLPAERFVAQVGLRLPRRSHQTPLRQGLGLAWRAVPFFLFTAWIFIQVVITQSGWLQALVDLGLWDELATLGASAVPDAGTLLLWDLALSGLIGIALLGWVASWWMRETHKSRLATE